MDAGTPPVKSEAIRQAARHMEDIARTLNSIARPWQPMKTAPRDGSIVLVLLGGVDYPHPAYWLTGPDSQRAISNGNNAPGWRMALDAAPIADPTARATGWTALTPLMMADLKTPNAVIPAADRPSWLIDG